MASALSFTLLVLLLVGIAPMPLGTPAQAAPKIWDLARLIAFRSCLRKNTAAALPSVSLGPPKGELRLLTLAGRNSEEYVDEAGTHWYLKPDSAHAELQSGAEVIGAGVYRALGYPAPEVYIIHLNGKRYAASRALPEGGLFDSELSGSDDSRSRQLRVVVAYLKDWDRIESEGANNFRYPDGSAAHFDFGGALGAKALGDHKPGTPFSPAIGVFEATEDVQAILASFRIRNPDHPWNRLTAQDARASVESFRRALTDDVLKKIVADAQYSEPWDANYMLRALQVRRDAIINGLVPLVEGRLNGVPRPAAGPARPISLLQAEGQPSWMRGLETGGDMQKETRAYLDSLSAEAMSATFEHIYQTSEKFRDRIQSPKSTMRGYPNVPDQAYVQDPKYRRSLQAAFLSQYGIKMDPGYFCARSPSRLLSEELRSSAEFRLWLSNQAAPSAGVDPDEQATHYLAEWAKELNNRYTPKPAKPTEYLRPEYERELTYARIGNSDYVSTPDGSRWRRIGGDPNGRTEIPRWRGDVADFRAAMRNIDSLEPTSVTVHAPRHYRVAPMYESPPIYNSSGTFFTVADGNARMVSPDEANQRTQAFLDSGSFGYHVTQGDRLEGIENKGWLLNQKPTSLESAQSPGLHLSTHLGVSYEIRGDTVILRVPMNPTEYRVATLTPYFGHVVRANEMSADQVHQQMQFSPDGGVSWYPMTAYMVGLYRAGLLPRLRARPVY